MNSRLKYLASEYKKRKNEIRRRLKEFASVYRRGGDDIFAELCFCIMTANANALKCDEALQALKKRGLLLDGLTRHIMPHIKGRVRFHNKKARFIRGAREVFRKDAIDPSDVIKTRDWLVKNVKGIGYKEASHFLRNIGLGRDIAILDRHILKNLKSYGVISKIPDSLGNRKVYLDIEGRMRRFSARAGIPMADLDLLFWAIETGFVFK